MLKLVNLDPETRRYMLAEADDDIERKKLYLSERLTPVAQERYPAVLREALASHDDEWLAANLRRLGLRDKESYRKGGQVLERKVPVNAAEMLAEGEFNRFYLRGLCRRVIESGEKTLVIYRAKPVTQPRPESERKIGAAVDAEALLRDLREHVGVDTALGLPPGPNSGLSARLATQTPLTAAAGE